MKGEYVAQIRIRTEGADVILIAEGKAVITAPWNAALDIAHELVAAARRAEEHAKAENIIFDNALLIRSGAPFGLSSHKDIVAESIKEAGHNTTIRRHMPGGIKSTSIVGAPEVRHG